MHKSNNLPDIDGLTDSDILEAIERAVAYLAPSFRFGYFDIEDVKQEGTIFSLEALKSFNFKKSNQENVKDALLTFLKTHVRWRFLNMRRKQLSRVEPPECSCELCQCDSGNRLDCKKYSNWVKRNMSKRSLMEPFNVNEVYNSDVSVSNDLNFQIMSSEFLRILNEHMPASLRADYKRLIEGASLPKNRKEKVVHNIKELLRKHYKEKGFLDEDGQT